MERDVNIATSGCYREQVLRHRGSNANSFRESPVIVPDSQRVEAAGRLREILRTAEKRLALGEATAVEGRT